MSARKLNRFTIYLQHRNLFARWYTQWLVNKQHSENLQPQVTEWFCNLFRVLLVFALLDLKIARYFRVWQLLAVAANVAAYFWLKGEYAQHPEYTTGYAPFGYVVGFWLIWLAVNLLAVGIQIRKKWWITPREEQLRLLFAPVFAVADSLSDLIEWVVERRKAWMAFFAICAALLVAYAITHNFWVMAVFALAAGAAVAVAVSTVIAIVVVKIDEVVTSIWDAHGPRTNIEKIRNAHDAIKGTFLCPRVIVNTGKTPKGGDI